VKSKETVDDGASDESNRGKDDTTVTGDAAEAGAADGKRKRPSHKSRTNTAPKDGKLPRKRPTKNKVHLCMRMCACVSVHM